MKAKPYTEIFGICSRVKYAEKGYPKTHFLLMDIDGDFKCLNGTLHWLIEHKIRIDFIVKTKHGWHIFCFQRFTFEQLQELMPRIPNIDQKWIRIGLKRGYWFLWTRTAIIKPDGLARYITFMKIRIPEENEWMRTKMGCFSHPKTEQCLDDAKDFKCLFPEGCGRKCPITAYPSTMKKHQNVKELRELYKSIDEADNTDEVELNRHRF